MKPCKHDTKQDGCRVCELFETDERYRKLWSIETPTPKHDPFQRVMTDQERAKLRGLLTDLGNALHDRQWFVCWGGLLGYVRCGDLLPWDDDLDILCVDPPTVEELQKRLPHLVVSQDQYLKVYHPDGKPIPGRTHKFPFIEINPAKIEDGCTVTKSAFNLPDDRFPLNMVFPTIRGKVGDTETNLPAWPKELAVFKYGPQCLTSALPPVWSHRHERKTGYPQVRKPLSDLLPQYYPATSSPVTTRATTSTTVPERTYLINLERRPDRLQMALAECERAGITPIVFKAVDGRRVSRPKEFESGSGAWGCRESHRLILEECIRDGIGSVLVLEDDVTFSKDFKERFPQYLAELPGDYDAAFIGGQHISPPTMVSPTVLRCGGPKGCHRTHGYVAKGEYIKTLHDMFAASNVHIDHTWGAAQKYQRVYAPLKWLAYQGESKSDINMREHKERRWEPRAVRQEGKVVPVTVATRPTQAPKQCGQCKKKVGQ